MSRSAWIAGLILLTTSFPSPSRAGVSLGANMSLAQVPDPDGNGSIMFSSPSDLAYGIQPGLRLGLLSSKGLDEVYFDGGVLAAGSSTFWSLTANYQRLLLRSPTSPYLTAGGGFNAYGLVYRLRTNSVFGGGLGVRHVLGHGHGAVRGELRYDVLHVDVLEENFTSIGLKLGFDLWLP